MSPRERFVSLHPAAARLALLVLTLVAVGAPGALPAQTESATATPAAAAAESDLGERVRARFEADALRDGVLLRPREAGGTIRSIELADDGEILVNGKEFAEEELASFLGADGALVAELAGLDGDERRRRLGLEAAEGAAEDEGADVSVGVDLPGVPPLPPLPGVPRVHVRSSKEDRVSIGRSIELAAGETAKGVVCIGCSVEVAGHAFGDAVAVGGSVEVLAGGKVEGSAVAVGGSVELGAGAVVDGDAVAVGGSVETEPGAEIHGQRSSVGWGGRVFGDSEDDGWGGGWIPFGVSSSLHGFVWSLFRAGFLALLVGLCLLIARPAVRAAERRLVAEPWKAVFAGLLTQLLFLPVLVLVTVILAVSIIGIPLLVLVPVAIVALVVGALVGFAAVASALGGAIEQRFGARLSGPFLVAVVGVAAIQGLVLIGRLIGLPGGVLGFFGFTLIALGFCIKYVAWTLGLGAMTLVAFGRDWRRPLPEPAAIAPPVPPAPAAEPPARVEPEREPEPPTSV